MREIELGRKPENTNIHGKGKADSSGSLPLAIQIEDLTVAYQEGPVLWDIDIDFPKGQLICIVGPNGAGKSTLLKAMLGLLKPLSGHVGFLTDEGIETNIEAEKKQRIAYVPQSGSVDWDFPATVYDVVLMGSYGKLGWFRRPKKKDRQRAHEMIEKLGMTAYTKRQISQLSGGQQQRVFLARALVQDAEIYLLDEPFKGVDAQSEMTLIRLLKQLRDAGKTVILVHHDLHTVKSYFDWVVMVNLQLIASGPVETTFTKENLERAYGQSLF